MKKVFPIVFFILLLAVPQLFSQTSYSFKGAQLISGVDRQIGAQYLFSNVKSNTDALVTVTDITPGASLTELDAVDGFNDALQPAVSVPGSTSGYVEFSIVFVEAGTSTPAVMPDVSVTGVDIDGSLNGNGVGNLLQEFTEVDLGGGYVDFSTVGGQLGISQNGTAFRGINVGGKEFEGRDTLAKEVMFTVLNNNVSTMVVRTGVTNNATYATSRQTSVYFRRFDYTTSTMALVERPSAERKKRAEPEASFRIYPNVIRSSATMEIVAKRNDMATIDLIDYNGVTVMKKKIVLNKGVNAIPFDCSSQAKGYFVAVVRMDGKIYQQRLIRP